MQEELFHVHRLGNEDYLWHSGAKIIIDSGFCNQLYRSVYEENSILMARFKDYDVDQIIETLEEMKFVGAVPKEKEVNFDILLDHYYFLRREKAMEEGRKYYAPQAPSRLHSIFLSNANDLYYWENQVGDLSFSTYKVGLEGNLFMSSDDYFPDNKLLYEQQVEESRHYWQPKVKKLLRKSIYFKELVTFWIKSIIMNVINTSKSLATRGFSCNFLEFVV